MKSQTLTADFFSFLNDKISLFLMIGALISSNAFAITRIGNAKFGSEFLGFEGTLEKPFIFLTEEDNDSALFIAMGDGILRDGEPLSVFPLERALPGFNDLSREEFRSLFAPSKLSLSRWTPVRSKDNCVDAFVTSSSDGQNNWGVSSWGNGKGIVFFGSNKTSVRKAIAKMLQSIEVMPGACKWE